MATPTDTTITLMCGDGDRVVLDAVSMGRSHLIQTSPSLPEEISVPFSKREVATWHTFSDENASTRNCMACFSALKVADFLQDEATAVSAAKAANACLFATSRKRQRSAAQPKKPSADTIHSLETLHPHLLNSILLAGGQVGDWLRVLPAACTPLAVSAAVQDNSLALQIDNDSNVRQIIAAVRSLSEPVLSLKIVFISRCGVCTIGKEAAAEIATLTQLESVIMTNMNPPDPPSTLTALTHLRIDHTDASCPRTTISRSVSALRSLKEFAVVNVWFSDFSKFAKQLPSLNALTSLELCYPASQDVTVTDCQSSVFGEALSACNSLARLTLGIPHTFRQTSTGKRIRDFFVSRQIIIGLAAMPSLTFLCFSGKLGMGIQPQDLLALWGSIANQLRHLSIISNHRWRGYVQTLSFLSRLERLSLCTLAIQPHDADFITTDVLPVSLTSLEVDSPLERLPNLESLTNLRSIRFSNCCLTGEHLTSLAALQQLQMLSTGVATIVCMDEVYGVALLRALPACMTELCLTNHIVPVGAVPVLATLTALQHLDIGTVASDLMPQSLASHMSSLCELRKLSMTCSVTCAVGACGELLDSLRALPRFEALDAGADWQELWSGR